MRSNFLETISIALRRPSRSRLKKHLHCYCLGLDIVGYSKNTTDVQHRMVCRVKEMVSKSESLNSVRRQDVVLLPTGDGMIVCLLESKQSPILVLDLAIEIQKKLKEQNQKIPDEKIVLRMGIHSGTGFPYIDINEALNLAGTVVNSAQRVMEFGEDWHIIASKTAYDDIGSLDKTVEQFFHKIGLGEDKHKNFIELYNVYRDGEQPFGNGSPPARVEAMKLQVQTQPLTTLRAADLVMNIFKRTVVRAGKTISLTQAEFSLLQLFLQNKNVVLTRKTIAKQVWGYKFDTGTNIVDVYITYLRDSVDKGFAKKLILTVRGGFMLRDSE